MSDKAQNKPSVWEELAEAFIAARIAAGANTGLCPGIWSGVGVRSLAANLMRCRSMTLRLLDIRPRLRGELSSKPLTLETFSAMVRVPKYPRHGINHLAGP